MSAPLVTERLVLRQWTDSDREPLAAMSADAEVMKHFPARLERAQADLLQDRLAAGIAERGWGFWAVELRSTGQLAGFIGLNPVSENLPCAPGVEIGWRLARAHWGQGYATEGARKALAYGFDTLGLAEIVAFTTVQNEPSQALMRRLGMSHDPTGDFDHPGVPADWDERKHVLYRIAAVRA